MKPLILNIVSFFAGIIGGIVALIIAILLEIVLSIIGKPPLSLSGDPIFLFALIIPAFLEEITKVTVAKRLYDRWGNPEPRIFGAGIWTIIGTGIGFGLAETYLAQNDIPFRLSSTLFPIVHLIFLIGGYFIARHLTKEGKSIYIQWLIASALLHWGYNVAQVVFLLKP